jgi:AcrR family transcriptional regulator
MPNKTFNNLSTDRQNEIKEIAMKEFLEHDYDSASLNQIVQALGITRGSFYRYFDGKEALYRYLIDETMKKKNEYINLELELDSYDFFVILKNAMKRHVRFMQQYPLQAGFLSRVLQNGDISVQEFLFLESGKEILSEGVRVFQKEGTLNSALEPDLIIFILTRIMMGLGPFLQDFFHVGSEDTFNLEKYDSMKMEGIFDQVILILKKGLL